GRFIGERIYGLLLFFFELGRLVHQRIQEHAARPYVDNAPLALTRHRIDVALPQEPDLVGALQILHGRRIFLPLSDVQLNGTAILLTALDQQRFLVALGFERHARQLPVQQDRDGGGHHKHEQHGKSFLPLAAPFHPACSCCNISVCRLFLCSVSSTITEFTWI